MGHSSLIGNVGLGAYVPEWGDTALRLNAGGGRGYSLSPQWSVALGYNFHKATARDKDEFSTVHLGFRYRFGSKWQYRADCRSC